MAELVFECRNLDYPAGCWRSVAAPSAAAAAEKFAETQDAGDGEGYRDQQTVSVKCGHEIHRFLVRAEVMLAYRATRV